MISLQDHQKNFTILIYHNKRSVTWGFHRVVNKECSVLRYDTMLVDGLLPTISEYLFVRIWKTLEQELPHLQGILSTPSLEPRSSLRWQRKPKICACSKPIHLMCLASILLICLTQLDRLLFQSILSTESIVFSSKTL